MKVKIISETIPGKRIGARVSFVLTVVCAGGACVRHLPQALEGAHACWRRPVGDLPNLPRLDPPPTAPSRATAVHAREQVRIAALSAAYASTPPRAMRTAPWRGNESATGGGTATIITVASTLPPAWRLAY